MVFNYQSFYLFFKTNIMKKLFFSLFALCALYSCNNADANDVTSDAAPVVEEVTEVVTEDSTIEVATEDSAETVSPDTEEVTEEVTEEE